MGQSCPQTARQGHTDSARKCTHRRVASRVTGEMQITHKEAHLPLAGVASRREVRQKASPVRTWGGWSPHALLRRVTHFVI